ncbi:Ig-like domain-containing protein [Muricomes sp. OA1]|uniref:Ig-like domain-containing protein n=1 Tax=Muricomes sp. OA1 TaxID=2914165 RepID=UPI001F06D34B|nr:Ig-like domain-containing protein [Muricomes sp. OA1]MCH1973532.1 Ig-like domain-containing protein [Muricomes sp. OA1]
MSVKAVQATINGQSYNLTLNSSTGKWEATVTAPSTSSYKQSGHYYGVSLRATDNAGNAVTKDASDATLGNSLRLVVKEKVAPVITITAPSANALIINNKPAISWTVTDNDSGVNPDTIKLTIDSGSAITGSSITKEAITNGYRCTYTPTTALSDGSHTVKVDASDYDGNAATQKSSTFKIDTVPPVLSVTSPANGLETNQAKVTVAGTTNDVTSSPVTLTIKLNSGAAEAVTVASDGKFSKELTLTSGTNTITIVATDGAGKSTTVTRTVKLDTAAPVISAVTLTPNPVDAGKTFVISVTVTD